jgi:hypothetical protein
VLHRLMSERYPPVGLVSPFIIAPAAGALQQRVMVAPQGFIPFAETFSDRVLRFTALVTRLTAPVVCQAFWFRGYLVLCTTVQTMSREDFSGRFGISVTVGALVAPAALAQKHLCFRIYESFARYFDRQFNSSFDVNTVERLTMRGSVDVDTWNADLLVAVFAEEFGAAFDSHSAGRAMSLFRQLRTWYTLRGAAEVRIASAVQDSRVFWRMLDSRLNSESNSESARPDTPARSAPETGAVRDGSVVMSLACIVASQFALGIAFMVAEGGSWPTFLRIVVGIQACGAALAALIATSARSQARSWWERGLAILTVATVALSFAVCVKVLVTLLGY